MARFYCDSCGNYTSTYSKRVSGNSPGRFIAGNMMGDSDLPIVGVQLDNSYSINACSKCGRACRMILSKEEDKARTKEANIQDLLTTIAIIAPFAIIIIVAIVLGAKSCQPETSF